MGGNWRSSTFKRVAAVALTLAMTATGLVLGDLAAEAASLPSYGWSGVIKVDQQWGVTNGTGQIVDSSTNVLRGAESQLISAEGDWFFSFPNSCLGTTTETAKGSVTDVDPDRAGFVDISVSPGQAGTYGILSADKNIQLVGGQVVTCADGSGGTFHFSQAWLPGGVDLQSGFQARDGWFNLTGSKNETLPGLPGATRDVQISWSLTPFPDIDHDGWPDDHDNCRTIFNPDQADSDRNGVGDVCDATVGDADGDGIADSTDNCPSVANPDQLNTDGDGLGDVCDLDDDNDGLPDDYEMNTSHTNPLKPDTDGGGVPDGTEVQNGTNPLDPRDDHRDCRSRPEQDPVTCYAPLVKLHPLEVTFPMDIASFASHSALKWAHDGGCPDETIAQAGTIDFGRLGLGASNPYGVRQSRGLIGRCSPYGRTYYANELTRPVAQYEPSPLGRAADLDKGEGFYLDLDDAVRLGVLSDANNQVQANDYFSFDGNHITYWFMYGFNQGAPGLGARLDRHEGEWERVTVDLGPDGRAAQVRYWVHDCTTPMTVPWASVQTFAGHPVVYSALGSHASYPDARLLRAPWCDLAGLPLQGAGDVTSDGGPVWATWGGLVDAATQPWYEFGGAWGATGSLRNAGTSCGSALQVISCKVTVTGPLGPDYKPLFSA